jgi:hypothetical protein
MSTDTRATVGGAGANEDADPGENDVLLGADSEETPLVSVVMPTLNEEEGVAECIERIKTGLREAGLKGEVILSDDSTDSTPEIGREMGAIVVTPDGKGYGYAYQYAFEHCRGEYIVIGDADTTYDFEQIPRLLEPVREGEADMCMGSRLNGEIKPGAMPALHQYVGNPLLTRFLNVFYGAGVSDAHSGFRVIHRDALDELDLSTTGMEFASEMIMEAGARDLTIEEKPIVYHEREGEATLESFRDGWRHVRFMLVNAPGYLFTVPGAVMGALGIVVMLLAFFGVGVGNTTFGVHSMIAGGLLTIVGHQVASLGVFATVATNPIRRPDDPATTLITERVGLEQGATAGLLVFGAGATYAFFLVAQWAQSGFTRLPFVNADVAAFVAIVVGLQILFNSFFLSAIASDS